jgi:hypothetical protein
LFSDYLYNKPSNIDGTGTFSKIEIEANKPIIEITGHIFNLEDDPKVDINNCLQVTNKWFIAASGNICGFINHSCNPNCYLNIFGKRAILYSLYKIPANTELTFDYSLSSKDTLERWKMECKCKQFKCRKIISGFFTLEKELQENYIKRDLVPRFVFDKNFKG